MPYHSEHLTAEAKNKIAKKKIKEMNGKHKMPDGTITPMSNKEMGSMYSKQ